MNDDEIMTEERCLRARDWTHTRSGPGPLTDFWLFGCNALAERYKGLMTTARDILPSQATAVTQYIVTIADRDLFGYMFA